MADDSHIGLDNSAFRGRLKSDAFTTPEEPVQKPVAQVYSEFEGGASAPIPPVQPEPPEPNIQVELVKPEPFIQPAKSKLSKSKVLSRQTVGKPLAGAGKKFEKNWTPIQVMVVSFAAAVFLVGLIATLSTMHSNNQAQAQLDKITKTAVAQQKVKVGSVLGSSTTATTSTATPPTDPSAIKIPSIKLHTNIEPITASANNVLSGPSNRLNAGWNTATARPADPNGFMVIDGYHGTKNLPGAFANLNKLKVNDQITIIRGDNQYYTYSVVRVTEFDPLHSDLATLLVPAKAGIPALNLITLSSGGDDTNNSVGTVVYAVQQS